MNSVLFIGLNKWKIKKYISTRYNKKIKKQFAHLRHMSDGVKLIFCFNQSQYTGPLLENLNMTDAKR
jgi:hypothetical protein